MKNGFETDLVYFGNFTFVIIFIVNAAGLMLAYAIHSFYKPEQVYLVKPLKVDDFKNYSQAFRDRQ